MPSLLLMELILVRLTHCSTSVIPKSPAASEQQAVVVGGMIPWDSWTTWYRAQLPFLGHAAKHWKSQIWMVKGNVSCLPCSLGSSDNYLLSGLDLRSAPSVHLAPTPLLIILDLLTILYTCTWIMAQSWDSKTPWSSKIWTCTKQNIMLCKLGQNEKVPSKSQLSQSL